MGFNIAIDGPAGAGKSTIARRVAKELDFIYVDTGAMYRAMALYFLEHGIEPEREADVEKACQVIEVDIVFHNGEQQVLLNGEDVSGRIRTEEVGNVASATSRYAAVRNKLLALQRDLAKREDVVMDGRDIGTHILPNAEVKIYLTANEKVRAHRRYLELKEKGMGGDLGQIEKDIVKRDEQDRNRKIAPLKKAEDAILIDSSNMTINEVVEKIVSIASRNVKLADTAGFCFGVKRAIDMVNREIEKGGSVYTLGPIIHNEEVVKDLEGKGVVVIKDLDELERLPKGTIVIRSHGVSKDIYETIRNQGFQIADATCPFVKKIHNIVEDKSRSGNELVIIGNANHPEVEGIRGWSEKKATVLETAEEAEKYEVSKDKEICVVAQTTYNYKKFKELVEILLKKGYHINAMNTICNATEERQKEARRLAKSSDAMIVVGGKNSSNTQKLYEICKDECESTYYIQTLDDLDFEQMKSFRSVGITAGASTPNNIIEEVQKRCQR